MIATTRRVYRRIAIPAVCTGIVACGGKGSPSADTASSNGSLAPSDSATHATTMVRGTVASVSATTLAVQTDTGTVQVQLTQPVRVYDRQPARLGEVTPNTFIGVTTVKAPDGTDQAKEIHIFPDELRGTGEGSRPMAAPASGGAPSGKMTNGKMTNGTMTNGTMTNGTMTNGRAAPAQMSNGTASAVGSTLVVQYAGGAMTAKVPANTPVTKIAATSKPLSPGERIVVVATRQANGSLASNRVMLAR